jgi:alkanesulfonate monooxygenase SsuD/methylene tetrahydromethanopterin reductase-like flavin-dependent oxidoreductase (luciferase family)
MFPKPVQSPVPIHIGGESDAALRIVARTGQGWHTFNRAPEDLDADRAERYAEAGADAVSALVVPVDEDSLRDRLDVLVPVQERAVSL